MDTILTRCGIRHQLETQSWRGINDDEKPVVIVENGGIGGLSPKLGQLPRTRAVNSNHAWFKNGTHKVILVQKFMMVKDSTANPEPVSTAISFSMDHSPRGNVRIAVAVSG